MQSEEATQERGKDPLRILSVLRKVLGVVVKSVLALM